METDGKLPDNPDQENGKGKNDQFMNTGETDNISGPNETDFVETGNSDGKGHSELVQMLLYLWQGFFSNPLLRNILRKVAIVVIIVLAVLFFLGFFIYIVPALQEAGTGSHNRPANVTELKNDPVYKKQITQIGKDAQKLSRKFLAYTPGQSYLVINTTDNRFSLYRNKKLVREGFCSTGSYTRLTNTEGSRHWIFKTPKGQFWIQQKITKPLWVRPDWSFVEEGLPIPPPDDQSRFEYGVLGDYAMSLGDGYLIHGTIYKRFLGMPVTHGCVRLNDDDLETIYNTLNIGSKVFIF
jgi:lipoprotein-anchoring transpeptidase ErfK/SrfK